MMMEYKGLTEKQVAASRTKNGSNEVTTLERETFFDKLWNNIKDPIIIILIVALGITMILAVLGFASWYEGIGIAIAVVIAILVATWSEHRNETTFQQLLEDASPITVKTFRSGHLIKVMIRDLVVGDKVLVQPGDMVPADGTLLEGQLELNQAPLTGESRPVKKYPLDISKKKKGENTVHAHEEESTLPRSALIVDGKGVIEITAVGDKTMYGKTIKEIVSAEDRLSPLQKKLSVLGKQISTFGYVGAILIAISIMIYHIFIDVGSLSAYAALEAEEIVSHVVLAITLAIIIIVVAVPEGLPMMIAAVLSLNMRKLLKQNVLVRKLLGIETTGSLTVLFTDKTGTITKGSLSVYDFFTGGLKKYTELNQIPKPFLSLLLYAVRFNTSAIIDLSDPKNPTFLGANSTERAILNFLYPSFDRKKDAHKGLKTVDTIPFSSSRKFSAAQVKGKHDLTLVKGAPEMLLPYCNFYLDEKGKKQPLDHMEDIEKEIVNLSKREMRFLVVAFSEEDISADHSLPSSLTLVGLFALRDKIRKKIPLAIELARDAGIKVVMMTGDSKETAKAIAKDVGLLDEGVGKVITSAELSELSDKELKGILPNLQVIARALPTDKSRLIKAAKDLNWVVGMTGDGVNDAPAVKNADVGFAMGSGTEMTKESSDIVILDDNFSSITQAILFGRTLFKSIRKFLVFQLSINVAAIIVAWLGPFFGYELPLTMTQLLWINLIMDTLAGIAIAGEYPSSRTMHEEPIPKDAPIITREMWVAILIQGISMAVLSLAFLKIPWIKELFRGDEEVLLTAFFSFFVFIANFNTFNARTQCMNLFDNLGNNKNFIIIITLIFIIQVIFTYFGGEVLRTVPLHPKEWLYIIGFSFVIIPIDILRKFIWKIKEGKSSRLE